MQCLQEIRRGHVRAAGARARRRRRTGPVGPTHGRAVLRAAEVRQPGPVGRGRVQVADRRYPVPAGR